MPNKEEDKFSGDDKKHPDHILLSYERWVINTLLPRVPMWMSTVHLTLMTFAWALGVVVCGYWAAGNIRWLWGFSACILLQHITDMLDGAVGRARNEGFVKWGFYMDHFLDYIFTAAIVIGYSFLLPAEYFRLALLCLAAASGFMVHVVLDFAVTNDFKISFNRFGVAEIRYVLIAFNTVLIFSGKELFAKIFPFIVLVFLVALGIVVYQSQKIYRSIDRRRQEANRH